MKPHRKIVLNVRVGIYDDQYSANVYADRIVLRAPIVKRVKNSGSLDFERTIIMNDYITEHVIYALAVDNEAAAWSLIGGVVGDDYLKLNGTSTTARK
jgi:hypothetical protein